ncbi:MAG: hypothetical protein HQK55_04945 [Deltaproteobacteria bacterium]|nr:hypothetical protein [Deltaproteobacteria bacterium]
MTKTLTQGDLKQFTGSEHWYLHGLVRGVLYIDGAKFVADTACAYWLLDEIALARKFEKKAAPEEFQLWRLTVEENKTKVIPFQTFSPVKVSVSLPANSCKM